MRIGAKHVKRWHLLALLLILLFLLALFRNGRDILLVFIFVPYFVTYTSLDSYMGSELRVSFGTLLVFYAVISLLFVPRKWRLVHFCLLVCVYFSLFVFIQSDSDVLLDTLKLPSTIKINEVIRRTDEQNHFPYRIKLDTSVDAPMEEAKKIYEETLEKAGATLLGYDTYFDTNDDNPTNNVVRFRFGNDGKKIVEVYFSILSSKKTRVVIRAGKSFFNSFEGKIDPF